MKYQTTVPAQSQPLVKLAPQVEAVLFHPLTLVVIGAFLGHFLTKWRNSSKDKKEVEETKMSNEYMSLLLDLKANMVTKEDIKDTATKADLENMATKEDIKDMATKADLANMATKDDIKDMATKDDIKNMATKDDLTGLATKAQVTQLSTKVEELDKTVHGFGKRLDAWIRGK